MEDKSKSGLRRISMLNDCNDYQKCQFKLFFLPINFVKDNILNFVIKLVTNQYIYIIQHGSQDIPGKSILRSSKDGCHIFLRFSFLYQFL